MSDSEASTAPDELAEAVDNVGQAVADMEEQLQKGLGTMTVMNKLDGVATEGKTITNLVTRQQVLINELAALHVFHRREVTAVQEELTQTRKILAETRGILAETRDKFKEMRDIMREMSEKQRDMKEIVDDTWKICAEK
eukprot:g4318.t1